MIISRKIILLSTFGLLHSIYGQVGPLLTTKWNQGCNYNASCPTTTSGGACGRTYTGCNATGWAQILKYYSFPANGMGYHCNTIPSYTSHCMDFSTQTYNYSTMPNTVTSSNPEVAKLMYHLGIAMDMNWSGTNSTSSFDSKPLKKYFKYTPRMYSMNYLIQSYTEILDSIKSELNAGRPVFVKSNTLNHFYIIDGYNASNQVHCNFGWGGLYDGYYNITNVNTPAGNATPHIFLLNIRPLNGTLETAKDTIVVPSGTGSYGIEFTSLSSWNITTTASWIALSTMSGSEGYFDLLSGVSFSVTLNNGPVRYGYIIIQNTSEIDTIVVKQESSPLKVHPDTLYFSSSGGSQTFTVECVSYGTWNSSTPDSWISYTPVSSTGNTTVTINVSNNSGGNRMGYIYFNYGLYKDTLVISQAGLTTNINNIKEKNIFSLYPNPTQSKLTIHSKPGIFISIYDITGRKLKEFLLSNEKNEIDLQLPAGMYLLRDQSGFVNEKIIVVNK